MVRVVERGARERASHEALKVGLVVPRKREAHTNNLQQKLSRWCGRGRTIYLPVRKRHTLSAEFPASFLSAAPVVSNPLRVKARRHSQLILGPLTSTGEHACSIEVLLPVLGMTTSFACIKFSTTTCTPLVFCSISEARVEKCRF